MILREYDIEEITYSPGKYRVVERLPDRDRVIIDAGLQWMDAQKLCGALEGARQRFIEDNQQLINFPEVVEKILEPDGEMNRPATVLALAHCIRSGGRMVKGKCIK